MKRKILVFGSIPPPFHGTSIAFRNLITGLQTRNFSIEHVNCQFSKSINEIEKFSFGKFFLFFKYFFLLIYKCISFKPEYVILCPAFSFFSFIKDSIYSNLVSVILNRKVIAWIHGNGLFEFYNQSSPLARKYIAYTFHNYNLIVPVAHRLSEINYNFFSPLEKIVTIQNGIVSTTVPQSKKISSNGKVTIFYLSNMELTKGWKLLFEAAQILCKKSDQLHFHFYGNPAANSTLDEIGEIFRSSVFHDRVCYLGPLNHEVKNQVFQEMDIFCLPTYYKHEALPLVILEAMRSGLPVVSTTAGGISEAIVDNKGGFIIEQNNLNELVYNLEKLINDKELRIRFGEYNLAKFRSDFTLDVHLDKWDHLLSK